MKTIISIFCLYTPDEIYHEEDHYLLHSLRELSDYLLVVINGAIKDKKQIEGIADHIIERENKGFDAGAYKAVICNSYWGDKIREYDVVVLCNNSFFGPFIPFSQISDQIDKKNVDFWGITSSEKNLNNHIQSYFLSYNVSILKDDLHSYFSDHIDNETTDFYLVCASFECGLFDTMLDKGYKYDCFIKDITCDLFKNPYGSLVIDGVPLLKKKVFNSLYYNQKQISSVLQYIKTRYDYPIEYIYKYMERNGIQLDKGLESISCKSDIMTIKNLIDRSSLQSFVKKFEHIWIYGAGGYARQVFSNVIYYTNNTRFNGFLITDQPETSDLFSYPIIQYKEELPLDEDTGIIVAMKKEPSIEVKGKLFGYKNVLYLWDDLNE